MVFLSCGGWCLVFSRCRRSECRCEGPTGTYVPWGLCPPTPIMSPFKAQNGSYCSLSSTQDTSVFAWQVRLCFSCTWGFGVVAGKQGWFAPLTGEGGASQERTSGQACCSVSVQRTWWCLASILLLLKLHVRGILADVYKIPFHMFLKTTLTWEAPLLFF